MVKIPLLLLLFLLRLGDSAVHVLRITAPLFGLRGVGAGTNKEGIFDLLQLHMVQTVIDDRTTSGTVATGRWEYMFKTSTK